MNFNILNIKKKFSELVRERATQNLKVNATTNRKGYLWCSSSFSFEVLAGVLRRTLPRHRCSELRASWLLACFLPLRFFWRNLEEILNEISKGLISCSLTEKDWCAWRNEQDGKDDVNSSLNIKKKNKKIVTSLRRLPSLLCVRQHGFQTARRRASFGDDDIVITIVSSGIRIIVVLGCWFLIRFLRGRLHLRWLGFVVVLCLNIF